MLKYYVKTTEALKRLRTDKDGVVSFEYVIVAACIVGAVVAVFGTGTAGAIGTALTSGIAAITTAFTAVRNTPSDSRGGHRMCPPLFGMHLMLNVPSLF